MPSKNKNIEPHQNITASHKKCINITNAISSVHNAKVTTLLKFNIALFLKINKRTHETSAEFLFKLFCSTILREAEKKRFCDKRNIQNQYA